MICPISFFACLFCLVFFQGHSRSVEYLNAPCFKKETTEQPQWRVPWLFCSIAVSSVGVDDLGVLIVWRSFLTFQEFGETKKGPK